MNIEVADDLVSKLAFAPIIAEGVKIGEGSPELWVEIEALGERYRHAFAGASPSSITELRPGRELYKSCGVDPTRRRPASEALLRRILHGKPLYRINNAVDCANFCSLKFLLPIGLYDASRIEGLCVTLRMGKEGEGYKGLGKEFVSLDGHILLADEAGPFGHPSGDSFRTRVREETSELLWIVFAPGGTAPRVLEEHAAFSKTWIVRSCGGSAVHWF